MAGLNDKEFKDFNDIVQNTLFGTMAEVSTFTNYTSAPKERGGDK